MPCYTDTDQSLMLRRCGMLRPCVYGNATIGTGTRNRPDARSDVGRARSGGRAPACRRTDTCDMLVGSVDPPIAGWCARSDLARGWEARGSRSMCWRRPQRPSHESKNGSVVKPFSGDPDQPRATQLLGPLAGIPRVHAGSVTPSELLAWLGTSYIMEVSRLTGNPTAGSPRRWEAS